ncbi:MAG: ornithine cyclodeaminase family protein [Acidobacteriota bacterium]
MALYLSEDDVARLLKMEDCIASVEEAFRQWAAGSASNRPRSRTRVRGGTLHVLPAASEVWGRMAVKAYASTRAGTRFVVLLFDLRTSDLLAVLEADRLGQIRTGAASGLATRLMARPDARTAAVIGSGRQARGQARGIAAVRRLDEIRAYGRDRDRLLAFCSEVRSACGVPVRPAASAEEAVRGADIVATATSSPDPVLRGEWLEPGTHVNAVGSNTARRREIDTETVRRADRIVVDDVEQARLEAGDLMPPGEGPAAAGERQGPARSVALERAVPLADLVSGKAPARRSDREITLFESLGLGLEDLAAATTVFDGAVAAGAGRPLPAGA